MMSVFRGLRQAGTLGLALGVALALSACSGEGEGPKEVRVLLDTPHLLVTDEDGLRVVRNRAPSPDFHEVALGPETERVRLGSEDPLAPDFFGRIASARLAAGRPGGAASSPAGVVVVAEGLEREVRIFRARDGRHLFTAGGPGEGPGEFVDASPVGIDAGGRLWVWDVRRRRFTVFDPSGGLDEVVPFGGEFQLSPGVRDLSPDGSFRAHLPRPGAPRAATVTFTQDTARVWAFDGPGAEPRLVFEDQGALFYSDDRAHFVMPLLEGSRVGYRGARVVGTDPRGLPGVRVVDDGGSAFRVEANLPARRARGSDREVALSSGEHPDFIVEAVRDYSGQLPLPEYVSPWVAVRVFDDGAFAVLRRGRLDRGERWDVFDAAGVQVGLLTLPKDATLADVREGTALVVERPSLAGPAVVLHAVPFASGAVSGTF
jgi:hypothetical protein